MEDALPRDLVGSIDWAGASAGNLTTRERLAFLGPIARTTAAYLAGRARLALGLRGSGRLDLEQLVLPDSKLATLAEQECRETLSPTTVNHSYRTFVFGLALADLDQVQMDVEQLYVASLLHDIEIERPQASNCFAVRGGHHARELCERAGVDDTTAWTISEAITAHITPGVDPDLGPLAPTIAGGTMVDLLGMRLWELDAAFVDAVVARWPRLGCTKHLAACWKAEAKAVPLGRAAALERLAMFSVFVRLAPYRE
jgi:hypothetical protein